MITLFLYIVLVTEFFIFVIVFRECKIFDIRNNKVETSSLIHKKGLTSGFFSPNGAKVLTTSNDDRLRIFDVTSLDHPKGKNYYTFIQKLCVYTCA